MFISAVNKLNHHHPGITPQRLPAHTEKHTNLQVHPNNCCNVALLGKLNKLCFQSLCESKTLDCHIAELLLSPDPCRSTIMSSKAQIIEKEGSPRAQLQFQVSEGKAQMQLAADEFPLGDAAAKLLEPLTVGGMSTPGLPSKKLAAFSLKPMCSTGMTGKSSTRVAWEIPKQCQMTGSFPATKRSCMHMQPFQRRRPRQKSTVLSKTGFCRFALSTMEWIRSLMERVCQIAKPILLSSFKAPNLRSVTAELCKHLLSFFKLDLH